MVSHTGDSYESSHEYTLQIDDLVWYSSTWKVLEVQIFHCHLVATRPCQPGLTHQSFLHLTKSIHFPSIEGDISRGSHSDIHSFWIEKIVMSVDHGWNQARENEASGNKHTWLLESIWIYLYVFNLETNHFWTKKCSKAGLSALKAVAVRNQSSIARIQSIHTQRSLESEFPIPSPLCIRVFSQKQLCVARCHIQLRFVPWE